MLKYLAFILLMVSACSEGPSPPQDPRQEMASFQVDPQFKIALVAAEPMVQDPVVIKFDEEGRLWVVEMRGFMPDIDAKSENAPVGRVSVLLDVNLDGRMDSSVVFADNLVLPRALAIVSNGALVVEDEKLWMMEDLNGDLVADTRTLIDPSYGTKGLIEHSPNGLWRGMDNWYYNAKSKYRYRRLEGNWIKEETEFRGQWGICHDNFGRLHYNYNWSQLHMDLVPPNYLSNNPNHKATSGIDYSLSKDRRIFPIRANPAVNRGYLDGTLDDRGSLIEFTSACAPYVYRGDLFHMAFQGNIFVCEPTGNLIKRNIIQPNGLTPEAVNAYSQMEFLASTDERFRPVWLTSGPDGALYVADMYRGIIQHGPYMSDYLREITVQRKLDRHINLGRVWRISPQASGTRPKPLKLSTATVNELVSLLGHKNGWYRDLSQRLMVERNEPETKALLQKVLNENPNHLARIHALWTLEGIDFADAEVYFKATKDQHTQVQITALRILEKIAQKDTSTLKYLEKALANSSDEVLDLQIALSARILNSDKKFTLLTEILTEHLESPVFRDAILSSVPDQEYKLLTSLLTSTKVAPVTDGLEIMVEMLAASVVKKRDHNELKELLKLVSVDSFQWQHRAIISGMSFHSSKEESTKVALEQAPPIFETPSRVPELDLKITRVSDLFTWPGKIIDSGSMSDPVITVADPEVLAHGRNLYLSICASCHGNDGQGMTRFAPPLVESEWVLGDPERLTRILLHGMEGPVVVNGITYDAPDILPEMPAFASTDVGDLAAVMTYIRQAWGHQAEAIGARTVGEIRVRTQGTVTPWTSETLLELAAPEK